MLCQKDALACLERERERESLNLGWVSFTGNQVRPRRSCFRLMKGGVDRCLTDCRRGNSVENLHETTCSGFCLLSCSSINLLFSVWSYQKATGGIWWPFNPKVTCFACILDFQKCCASIMSWTKEINARLPALLLVLLLWNVYMLYEWGMRRLGAKDVLSGWFWYEFCSFQMEVDMMSRARGQAESEILISNKVMLVGRRNAVLCDRC